MLSGLFVDRLQIGGKGPCGEIAACERPTQAAKTKGQRIKLMKKHMKNFVFPSRRTGAVFLSLPIKISGGGALQTLSEALHKASKIYKIQI